MASPPLEAQKLASIRWLEAGGMRCRSCKAAVVFAKNTVTDKRQIVDAKPNSNGNIYLSGTDGDLRCTVWSKNDPGLPQAQGDGLMHLDHHATCPEGEKWRTRGRFT